MKKKLAALLFLFTFSLPCLASAERIDCPFELMKTALKKDVEILKKWNTKGRKYQLETQYVANCADELREQNKLAPSDEGKIYNLAKENVHMHCF